MSSKQQTLTQLVSNKKQRTDDKPKGIAGSAITYEQTIESNASDPIVLIDDFPESTQAKPPATDTCYLDRPAGYLSNFTTIKPPPEKKEDITIIQPKSNFINVAYVDIYHGVPPDPSSEPSRQLRLKSDETGKRLLTVGGMFSGIGGLERAFLLEGHSIASICEINIDSQRVLNSCFDFSSLSKGFFPDVKDFYFSRSVDMVVLGFPCKDTSLEGKRLAEHGTESKKVFIMLDKLTERKGNGDTLPESILLENVTGLLKHPQFLDKILQQLSDLNYSWAMRILDSRCVGIPHKRRRLFIFASLNLDPRKVLLSFTVDPKTLEKLLQQGKQHGSNKRFISETGAGPSRKAKASTDNAMPTIKTDSDRVLVITHDGSIGIPDVRDIERLQGYPEDVTRVEGISEPKRRRMLGDTVTVPLVRLIARMLRHYDDEKYYVLPKLHHEEYIRPTESSWQEKCYYQMRGSKIMQVDNVTEWWCIPPPTPDIEDFLKYPLVSASLRVLEKFQKKAADRAPSWAMQNLEKYINVIKRTQGDIKNHLTLNTKPETELPEPIIEWDDSDDTDDELEILSSWAPKEEQGQHSDSDSDDVTGSQHNNNTNNAQTFDPPPQTSQIPNTPKQPIQSKIPHTKTTGKRKSV